MLFGSMHKPCKLPFRLHFFNIMNYKSTGDIRFLGMIMWATPKIGWKPLLYGEVLLALLWK